jgi:hypothetical protein
MARNINLIQLRNSNIKKRYREIATKNQKWRNDAVIEAVSEEFYLSARTITAILNDEGTYGQTG